MSSGEMKISDILKYSIRIEHESMNFYKEAGSIVNSQSVKELLVMLELEEVKHEKRLTDILKATDETLVVSFDTESLEELIRNSEVPAGASEEDILTTALGREKNTRDFYARIATMSNLSSDVIDLFDMLYNQESGHVTRVGNMLKKLKT